MSKKITKSKLIYIIGQTIMLLLVISCLVFFFLTDNDSQKSRLLFNAVQALLFIFITSLSRSINKRTKYSVPDFMIIIFDVFCLCHFVLGEIAQFYVLVKYWDSVLHTLSGFMLGILGFSFIQVVNQNDDINIKLGPVYCVIFALCFALTIGVLWEVIEFTIDGIFSTNMQRYKNNITEELLLGREALNDTMKDLILDTLGVSIAVILGGISIKFKGVAFDKWQFKKNNSLHSKKDF